MQGEMSARCTGQILFLEGSDGMPKFQEGSIYRVDKEMLLAVADDEIRTSTDDTCYIPPEMLKWLENEEWRIRLGEYNEYGCYNMYSVTGAKSIWVIPDVVLKKKGIFNSLE